MTDNPSCPCCAPGHQYDSLPALVVICESCQADDHGRCEERWCSWCDCECNIAKWGESDDDPDPYMPHCCLCGGFHYGGDCG